MQEYWPAVVIAVALFVGAIAIGMWIESDTHCVAAYRWMRKQQRDTRRILSPR